MQISKEIKSFIRTIVNAYAKYDPYSEQYQLNENDLCSDDLYKLSGLLLKCDESYSNESIGADNPEFYKTMLPSFIDFLIRPSFETKCEFIGSFRYGVVKYHSKLREELFDNALQEFNLDHRSERL